jgi:hypothetical protein
MLDITPFSFFCEYDGFEKFPFVHSADISFVADSSTAPEHLLTHTGGRNPEINLSHVFDVFPSS